jgi:hypothetical protein
MGNLRLLGGSVKTHLSDDETVAKMGHPISDVGHPSVFVALAEAVDAGWSIPLLQVEDGFGAVIGFAAVADISSR